VKIQARERTALILLDYGQGLGSGEGEEKKGTGKRNGEKPFGAI